MSTVPTSQTTSSKNAAPKLDEHACTHPLSLEEFRGIFNEELKRYFAERLSDPLFTIKSPLIAGAIEHARHIVMGGGKRVRPYLAYLAYVGEGGTDYSYLLRASVALELMHAFALMHDDIIDKGETRHGLMTTHRYVATAARTLARGDKDHLGEGIALLIGDLFLSWSHALLFETKNVGAQRQFFRLLDEVVVGQLLDVSLMFEASADVETLAKKNELKTARYSFVNPLLIGAALANSSAHNAIYEALGLAIGQAYQIQDDLLDVTGTVATLGKEPFLDVAAGQPTLLTMYVNEQGRKEDQEILARCFGASLGEADRSELFRIFAESGAIAFAEAEIARLLARGTEIIESTSLPVKGAWRSLMDLLAMRVS